MSPKPHAVFIPYPAQGHITPMLSLAKILHSHFNFHITFVNTEHNHRRLLLSRGPAALDGIPSFRFEAIPDGLPPSDPNTAQHIPTLSASITKHCHKPFKELVTRLNEEDPRVTVIMSDCSTSFSVDVAEEMGIPIMFFWTSSAAALLGFANYRRLIDDGIVPLKDSDCMTNGYLDQVIEGIPSMEGIRLRDFPSFVRTTNRDDPMLNLLMHRADQLCNSSSPIIFHTFDALEDDVLKAVAAICNAPVYAVGPLQLLEKHFKPDDQLTSVRSNLWKEDNECLKWLDSRIPNSVLYINFGSIAVVDQHKMVEMAYGLEYSQHNFLWIIRPDLVSGASAVLPAEFAENTKGRGFLAGWCDQKTVLSHPAVGGFLTHCGWNSTLDTLCSGVPVICWPSFSDQMTNCWFCHAKWGIGVQIDSDIKRNQVKNVVTELIVGEQGKEMKKRAMEWKMLAEEATMQPNGSSVKNLEELVKQEPLLPKSS